MPRNKEAIKNELWLRLYDTGKEKENGFERLTNLLGGFYMTFARNKVMILSSLSLVLIIGFYSLFVNGAGNQASAYVTFQVNPALQLVVDEDHNVIAVETLNDDAIELLNGLDLIGNPLEDVLGILTSQSNDLGFIEPDSEFVLTVRPAEDSVATDVLNPLATEANEAVSKSLDELDENNEVKTVLISNELYKAAIENEVLPAIYVELLEENVVPETIEQILRLADAEGIDKTIFLEEIETVSAAYLDLIEAGIPTERAIAILQKDILLDPTLEEVPTIIAASIDLEEAGIDFEKVVDFITNTAAESGIDKETFLEEFTSITAAYIDLIESGVSEDTALIIMKEAMMADASLEEITTITAAFIDLVDEGVNENEAANIIREALKSDPTLEQLDDIVESNKDEKDLEEERAEEEQETVEEERETTEERTEEEREATEERAEKEREAAEEHAEEEHEAAEERAEEEREAAEEQREADEERAEEEREAAEDEENDDDDA